MGQPCGLGEVSLLIITVVANEDVSFLLSTESFKHEMGLGYDEDISKAF